MEIKINQCILLDQQINGIGGDYDQFLSYFSRYNLLNQQVCVDRKKLTKKEKKKLIKKVCVVNPYIEDHYLYLSVYDYMKFQIIDSHLNLKDYRKKIKDSLKIVGLKQEVLNKKLYQLSLTEIKLIHFARALLFNPDILLFDCFLSSFDLRSRKEMFILFHRLCEKYHKIIVLCSNDLDDLYQNCQHISIYKQSKLLIQGDVNEVFENHGLLLEQNGMDIPLMIKFSDMVYLKKKVKLNYHKDIRDLIKDIYKKVK